MKHSTHDVAIKQYDVLQPIDVFPSKTEALEDS